MEAAAALHRTGAGHAGFPRPLRLIIALAIAITKALLIALFFMHIKWSSPVLRLAAVAGVMWLLILISLTLADYISRGWVPLNH